jgi:hypothetical protein
MQEIVQTVANERLAGLNRHRNIENDQIKGTDK